MSEPQGLEAGSWGLEGGAGGYRGEVRRLPDPGARVESGPVQFGDDWPGVFIRGDEALWQHLALAGLLSDPSHPLPVALRATLMRLALLLDSCRHPPDSAVPDPEEEASDG